MKENMTFEQALATIEQIIKTMEEGKLPLEQSVKAFDEGMELIRFCNGILDSYEKKIETVVLDNRS